jgi:glycosyltransferase involved in cell wall biosynthesis
VTRDHAPPVVVHVLGKLDRGGVETVVLNLCHAIPATEFQQVFLTTGDGEGRLAPRFRAAGARVHRLPIRPIWTFPLRLWRCLRAIRPRAVVSHVSLVSGLVLTVAAAAGVPVRIARMSSEGDGRPDTRRRRVRRSVWRAMLRRSATAVLGNTAAGVAFTRPPAGDPRYRVLRDGVDVDRFARVRRPSSRPGNAKVLVHIGRAAPEKNRGFLLRVHAEAERLCAGTRLVFAGPGGSADLVAADPNVHANPLVDLAGETDEVERLLGRADVLLLPSLREGLPGVVLEALSAGVPVLATDLPGLRDLSRAVEGLTVLPLDAGPRMWAGTALELARLPAADRHRLTDAMRGSRFTLASTAEQWRAVWTVHC